MRTYFASAERAQADDLDKLVMDTKSDPVLLGLLQLAEGLLVVLNEHRQVICINDALLDFIGVRDIEKVIGLRPGEMIHCVHAHDNEAGCGTGPTCASCGAAISIVTAQTTNQPYEAKCVATIEQGDDTVDLCLKVRSKPVDFHGRQLILLFLQDISGVEKREALERVFFHDLNNIISVLSGVCNYMKLADSGECMELAEVMINQTERMQDEVALQKAMLQNDPKELLANKRPVDINDLLEQVKGGMSRHLLAAERKLIFTPILGARTIKTDPVLVERVLRNMILNALEATQPGGKIHVCGKYADDTVKMSVRNDAYIPPAIQKRIFQSHFSSKGKPGRGFGTFSMKLLGEKALGGRVYYTTDKEKGSTFTLELPAE